MNEKKKFTDWLRVYAMEEPLLDLVYEIKGDHMPDIGFGFPSGDGVFAGGYILFVEKHPTHQQDHILHLLAGQENFVFACDDCDIAKQALLSYIKQEPTGNPGEFLPDEIMLN